MRHQEVMAVWILCLATSVGLCAPGSKPNIVLVMADDMGMGDTSAYQDFTGNPDDVQIHTPQMDRLARMGVRFTDAHTPASRCTPTRYGLLTGRYPWRSRMKWWVLFGSQGDPLIEADRPTLASMLRAQAYATGMVGKWHVGLRYRQAHGAPAAGWADADLTQPLHTSPLDFGFDFVRFTSRSHGTSGPDAGAQNAAKRNTPQQKVGPGHIHGRRAIGATGNGKQLVAKGPNAYVLTQLGGRHSDHAIEFLEQQVAVKKPFFLYYPSNSNHGPYTPDMSVGGKPVKGAARTKAGLSMDARHDYIYENDVALGRFLDWLDETDDPRVPGHKLISNTLVIFTSDNGAEKNSDVATGPFRSNKGSCYEGGHRVPFIVAWAGGGVGNGNAATPGLTSDVPIGLQDLYATFAQIVGADLPDLRVGQKGAEDSFSLLPAFRGNPTVDRPPLFFNDHKEAKADPAVLAMRLDSPRVDGRVYAGKWKIFFDADLLRTGKARPYELYNLAKDQKESRNVISDPTLKPLVEYLTAQALFHRQVGGHRLAPFATTRARVVFDWQSDASPLARMFDGRPASGVSVKRDGLTMTVCAVRGDVPLKDAIFSPNARGLGISGGTLKQVDDGEALLIRFNEDVIVEYAAIVAGNGRCGGFYQVGNHAPLAIYCVDADNDAKEQQGILSDIGVLKAGEPLRLDSRPHYGVEPAGQWRLGAIAVRVLK